MLDTLKRDSDGRRLRDSRLLWRRRFGGETSKAELEAGSDQARLAPLGSGELAWASKLPQAVCECGHDSGIPRWPRRIRGSCSQLSTSGQENCVGIRDAKLGRQDPQRSRGDNTRADTTTDRLEFESGVIGQN